MKYVLTLLSLLVTLVVAQATTIYQIDIRDDINSKTWIYTKQGFAEAASINF